MNFKRTLTTVAASVVLALGLAGCSSTGSHEPAELNDIRELVDSNEVWSTGLGESLTGLLVPAVTQTGIFAAGEDSLYRIDPETGDKIWEVNTESVITAGVGSDGQYVAVGTAAGEVEVYGNDGKRLWRVKLSSEMSTPPLVGAGFVIVRTADTRVTAFDALTGERRWRYQSQIPSLTLRAPSQMKFSPAGVLVGQANGRLLALDGQGRTVFDAVIAQPKGITEVERLVDVVGTPLVDANMMCAAAFQGGVVCMSAQNGRLLWQADVDAVTGPVTDGARVYVVTARGEINAYDYLSGKKVWSNADLLWRSPSAPVVIGHVIAVGDYDGDIHFIEGATGEIIGRTSVSGAVRVPPVPMPDGALFQSDSGELSYIRLSDNKAQ